MITAQNISKSYGLRTLFEKASFSVSKGERVGLVGRNGHGKTTLLKMIMGEESPDEGQLVIPKNYRIGYLTQQLNFTRETILEEALLGLPPERRHEEWTVKRVLAGLGYQERDFHRSPSEFSGGYQVRLNLAKVLVSDPDMLLLDEPTNFLDIISIRWLIEFLGDWRGELLLVTHDRNVMDSLVTHILGIHRGKIRKLPGTTRDYYGQISREEEIHENKRLNDERERKQMETFISKFRAKARQANLVQSRIKCLEKKTQLDKLEKISTLSFSFPSAPFEAKYPVEVSDLSFSYAPESPLLIRSLDLSLEKGDRLCVIGKNGRGKTTLLKLLSGFLTPLKGRVRTHAMIRTGYYEQAHTAKLNPEFTVEEEIASTGELRERKAIRGVCGAMMFSGDDALKKIGVLSGGEKCRVLLGKLLTAPTNLLILDEPTHHLDMESIEALMDALEEYEGTVIMVTHNEYLLDRIATKLVVFEGDRQMVFPGTYSEFLEQVGWEDERFKGGTLAEVPVPSPKTPLRDRETLKKIRAEFITRRSRVLTPLRKKVDLLEKQIMDLERDIADLNQKLVEASLNQDVKAMTENSKVLSSSQSQVNLLFDELALATEEHDRQKLIFDEEEKKLEE